METLKGRPARSRRPVQPAAPSHAALDRVALLHLRRQLGRIVQELDCALRAAPAPAAPLADDDETTK
jgi:hypothetical protein